MKFNKDNKKAPNPYIALADDNPMYECGYFEQCSISVCPLDSSGDGYWLDSSEAHCPLYYGRTRRQLKHPKKFTQGEKRAWIMFGKSNPSPEEVKEAKCLRYAPI